MWSILLVAIVLGVGWGSTDLKITTKDVISEQIMKHQY